MKMANMPMRKRWFAAPIVMLCLDIVIQSHIRVKKVAALTM